MNLDSEAGTPADWSRSTRLHPKMHVVVRAGPDPQNHALAVRDEHPRIIAVWNGRPPLDIRPKRGDKLVLEWKEMFTVGAGGTQTVSYRNIPPGRHVFRVMAVTPLGAPTGHSTGLTIIVPEFPFWRSAKFITWLIALTGFILLAQAVWLMRQRLKRQVERLQWQQAVEHERTRIARDIHDDLGTSLTRIAILSKSPRETADLKSISAITGEMTRTMDEIVWAVNPKKDSLDGLTNYLGAYAQELLSTANLRCRLDLPLRLPQWNLPAELRHNVFLAFKEALNNVLKHSGASEVHIALAVKPTHFVLTVKDNGRGFQPGLAPAAGVPASNTGGHGLANMRSRMEKIGGQFNLASSPDQGTTVSFTIKPSRMNDGAA
ncbi:MAG: sensor histidine kinase [Verrucomicrobia bacterium]|nr:sensor histidine kinase [Verrucomicrobiota bacterium]